ncbi:hypothetical protein C8R47DRAFT_97625 [Mycena vitilis]|nr:hypothetical protein C8R47DRAFT_97625 [Mycena vitilis]
MHIQCAIPHDSLLRSTAPHARRTNAITLPAAWTSAPRLQYIDTIIRSARLSSRGRAAVGWEWEADVTPQGEAAGLPISKSSPGAKNEMPEEDDVREKHISRPKQALRDADEATDVYFHSRRNCPPPSPNRTAVLSPNQRCPAHARQRDAREQLATPAHRAARSLALPLRAKPSGRCAIAASLSGIAKGTSFPPPSFLLLPFRSGYHPRALAHSPASVPDNEPAHASSVLSPSRSDPSLPSSLKSAVPIRQRDMQMDVELRAVGTHWTQLRASPSSSARRYRHLPEIARAGQGRCLHLRTLGPDDPSLSGSQGKRGGGGGGGARASRPSPANHARLLSRELHRRSRYGHPPVTLPARASVTCTGFKETSPGIANGFWAPRPRPPRPAHQLRNEDDVIPQRRLHCPFCPTSVSQNRSDRRKAAKARPSYNRAP